MKLYRPYIPFDARCRVAMRQLGGSGFGFSGAEEWNDPDALISQGRLGGLLSTLLRRLAVTLDCEVKDLHLDHDPALGARGRTGEGRDTIYDPPANDPRFLVYRTKAKHQEKTNLRGERGQHPDRVLIKRERRRRRGPRPKRKMRSRNDLRRTKVRRPQLPLPPRRTT